MLLLLQEGVWGDIRSPQKTKADSSRKAEEGTPPIPPPPPPPAPPIPPPPPRPFRRLRERRCAGGLIICAVATGGQIPRTGVREAEKMMKWHFSAPASGLGSQLPTILHLEAEQCFCVFADFNVVFVLFGALLRIYGDGAEGWGGLALCSNDRC